MVISDQKTMLVEKVASSPALSVLEGWSKEDASLSEDELAALHVALGDGMSASASGSEEQPERHSMADLPSLTLTDNTSSFIRLEPLIETHENSSVASADSDEPEQLSSKLASFYIGGDDGGPSRDGRPFSPRHSVSSPRRVSVIDRGKTKTISFTPPDGGYGWVVAFSACFVNIWIVGFIKSYGVICVAVREAFPEASAYHASWLPSLLSTVGLLIAPMTGVLCRRFTSRKVSFLGGLLCFLGLLLGSLAVSMNQLILSVGLLTGLGAGLTTTPGILIVSLYFEKRRAFASAICVSGNALGGFILPLLVDHLLSSYGFRGTLLVLAGLQLNICAASMLYRPISHHALLQSKKQRSEPDVEGVLSDKLLPSTPASIIRRPANHTAKQNKPVSPYKALLHKIVRHSSTPKLSSENTEVQHQVYLLRTASMMNSIPDLTEYARSWSMPGDQITALENRSTIPACTAKGSKASLLNFANSKISIMKPSLFAEHPSVLQLSSEEEGLGASSSVTGLRGSLRRKSQPRLAPCLDASRPSLARQSSVRITQNRIMEALKETEGDEPLTPSDAAAELASDTKTKSVCEVKTTAAETKESKLDTAEDKQPRCCALCLSCIKLCNSSMYQDGLFWVVAISVFLMACGHPFTLFYLPAFADSIDIPASYIPSILSISSVLDLVGRLGTGFISDMGIFKLHHVYVVCSLVAGVSVIVIPFATTSPGLTAVMAVYGLGVGSWFVMIPAILASHHGAAELSSSYGLVRLFNGVMNFMSPQLTGLLFDATGSYLWLYLLMGCSMVIGSVLVLFAVPAVLYYRSRQHRYAATPSDHLQWQS